MKSTSFSLVASAVLLGLVGACATSAGDDSIGNPTYDAGHDTGSKYDANVNKQDSAPAACATMCAVDSDCQTGCATGDLCSSGQCQMASTGVSCCDTAVGQCYIESMQCPVGTDGGGLE